MFAQIVEQKVTKYSHSVSFGDDRRTFDSLVDELNLEQNYDSDYNYDEFSDCEFSAWQIRKLKDKDLSKVSDKAKKLADDLIKGLDTLYCKENGYVRVEWFF
ncbi:hypothetical protein OFO01_07205 [Campylobacter sp. JMF_01 NE2]|nr:hypothetical protein [Campylobacter sp. JMF_01 NE2]MDA3067568.1 hypothetical protein [Campylobacter sp. JMF_01 NE2]